MADPASGAAGATAQTSRQQRTIFIAEIVQFGGAERSILALSSWLHRRGLSHRVLTYFDHCRLATYADHALEVTQLEPGPGARNKIAALEYYFRLDPGPIKPLLSGYQPALHATLAGLSGFHTLMHDTPSLFSGNETRSLARRLRTAFSNAIAGYGLRSGGETIVTSEYLRSECRKDFGVDAAIVRMGGFTAAASPTPRTLDGELRMLSVCRIEANKRIDWVLRSLAAMEAQPAPLSRHVDWRLDLAGDGSLIPELTQMAASLGIGSRVHFHGFVADEALAAMYDRAHLFLMPAIQGYGITAIESLQRGIPVLLHRDSGVSDILLDTPWATVLRGEEAEMTSALKTAIERVIAGEHRRVPVPQLPTEDDWAERVAALCGWV